MKKYTIILVAILAFNFSQSQNYNTNYFKADKEFYHYADFSFDANKAFDLKENDRTIKDIYGLDWDAEIGIYLNHFKPYLFYGEFKNAKFINWGVGLDYEINPFFKPLGMSLGGGYGNVLQDGDIVGKWHARAKTTLKIFKGFGISLRAQLQQRIDTSNGYIFEGAIGVEYIFGKN